MSIQHQTIYGEAIEDLLPAFAAFADAVHVGTDGMFHASVTLSPKDGLPFQRAMLRAEATLMLEDADELGSPRYEDRTHEQRAADAFVRLAQAVGEDPSIQALVARSEGLEPPTF